MTDSGRSVFIAKVGHSRKAETSGSSLTREITGLLAGLAAEELVLGTRGDGSGGSDGSDLQRATELATAMDVSLGLAKGLAYLSPNDDVELLHYLRTDSSLRRSVNQTLEECLARARSLLRANRPALEELADVLARRGRVSFEAALGSVMTVGKAVPSAFPGQVAKDSQS